MVAPSDEGDSPIHKRRRGRGPGASRNGPSKREQPGWLNSKGAASMRVAATPQRSLRVDASQYDHESPTFHRIFVRYPVIIHRHRFL
jgi:hypothetical protein